ncbi:MAG: hypothetical protein WDN03_16590 [Rhizomicrobium sp.]
MKPKSLDMDGASAGEGGLLSPRARRAPWSRPTARVIGAAGAETGTNSNADDDTTNS